MSLNNFSLESDSPIDDNILAAIGTTITTEQTIADPLEVSTEHLNTVISITNNVLNKKEVLNEISQVNTINKYQAEVVQDCFSDFIGNKVSLEEFTNIPTKTNYDLTLNFMKSNIKVELESLVDNWAFYISIIPLALEKYVNLLEDSLIPAVQQLAKEAPDMYRELYKTLTEGKDNIYSAGNEMLKIDSISILSKQLLSIDKVSNNDKMDRVQAILKTCFYEPGIYSLFKTVLNKHTSINLEDTLINNSVINTEADIISVTEFIYVLSSEQTIEYIDNIALLTIENIAQLRESIEYLNEEKNFFNDKLNIIYTKHLSLIKYQSFFTALERIYSNADNLVDIFK